MRSVEKFSGRVQSRHLDPRICHEQRCEQCPMRALNAQHKLLSSVDLETLWMPSDSEVGTYDKDVSLTATGLDVLILVLQLLDT